MFYKSVKKSNNQARKKRERDKTINIIFENWENQKEDFGTQLSQ